MLNMDTEVYLMAKEASCFLGISRTTFYQDYKRDLQAYRVGRRKRLHYKRSDLERIRNASPVAS